MRTLANFSVRHSTADTSCRADFYDGECQKCAARWSYRSYKKMSRGCYACGGTVIPRWALPTYVDEQPRDFPVTIWWSFEDVGPFHKPHQVKYQPWNYFDALRDALSGLL